MNDQTPPILSYQTPPRLRRMVGMGQGWTALLAVAVPGFASVLLGAPRRWGKFAAMSGTAIAAFVFFGPVWGELLYEGTPKQDDGMIPFLIVWATCILISFTVADRDRRCARLAAGLSV